MDIVVEVWRKVPVLSETASTLVITAVLIKRDFTSDSSAIFLWRGHLFEEDAFLIQINTISKKYIRTLKNKVCRLIVKIFQQKNEFNFSTFPKL